MNAGNIISPAMELPFHNGQIINCGHLDSFKAEQEKNEQPECSTSISKTIPIATLISNVIDKSKEVASDDELFDAMGSIIELIERYFSEQDEIKSSILGSEVVLAKFINEITSLSASDKEKVTTLQSRFADYQKFCDNEMTSQKMLGEKWDSILNSLHGLSSENMHIADVLEKMNVSTEIFSANKHELISLCENREALLNTISSHLSYIEERCIKS